MSKVAILVTHLSGTGHFLRALAIARAVGAAGGEAAVISGGRPLGHVDPGGVPVMQIPWLRVAGRDFSRPLAADGAAADEAFLARRRRAVESAVARFAPDVLVTETWPFGRRRLSAEFEAAIAAGRAVRPQMRLAVSVRDVPEPPSRPGRGAEAAERLRAADLVLVHGDPDFLPIGASWPVPPDIAPRFRHTGYVVEPLPEPLDAAPEVLVAVGGGDLGRGLLDAAAEAGAVSRLAWRLFVGGPDAEVHAARLAARHTAPGIAIEPVSAAYRARLPGALCSVSLTGYNTVAELARLPTPAVLVPDETGGEREQAIRAAALRGLPGVAVLTAAEATPARLGTEVARLAGTARPAFPVGIGGAGESARLLLSLARGEAAA